MHSGGCMESIRAPCASSTSGSRRTGGCGTPSSTHSNATSTERNDPMPTNEYGTLVERDGNRYLRFRRTLAHPVQKVWDALVDPDQMVKWLAEQKTLDGRV